MTSSGAKRVAIHTLGCRLNQGETRLIEDHLRQAGYAIVPFGEVADVGILHTCVVTKEAEAKSRKMIRRFVRENPGAIVVVIGCYAQTAAASIAAMEGVRLVLGNDAKMHLADHLASLTGPEPEVVCGRPDRQLFSIPFVADNMPITRRVNLKIQDGCDAMCTYCYIPFARGRSRSRQFEDAFAEAASLVNRGAKELVITGVSIGDYRDGDRRLTQLADALDTLQPKPRVRISSIELNTIPAALLTRMADPEHALAPHLHIPLQSGSPTILHAMGRPYMPEDYLAFVRRAADETPGIGLGADVMVGFPGETDSDFEQTCDLIRRSPLTYLHVFQYSERKQVASARLPGKVPPRVMQARSKVLLALGKEKLRAFQEHWIGSEVQVLFESRAAGYWKGHAGNYLEISAKSSRPLDNSVACVRIDKLDHDRLCGTVGESWGAVCNSLSTDRSFGATPVSHHDVSPHDVAPA